MAGDTSWKLLQPTGAWRHTKWGLADAAVGGAVALGASTVVSVVVLALMLPDLLTSADPPDSAELVTSVLANGPILAASLLALWLGLLGAPLVASRWRGLKSLANDFGFTWKPIDVAWGLGIGAALIAVSAVATTGLEAAGVDISDADNAAFLTELPAVWLPMAAAAVAIGAPLIEELFFRGLLLRAVLKSPLLARYSSATAATIAVLSTSVLFGIAHVSTPSVGGAVLFAITGGFGAVFAVLSIRTGRLGAAILAHTTVNAFGFSAAVFG